MSRLKYILRLIVGLILFIPFFIMLGIKWSVTSEENGQDIVLSDLRNFKYFVLGQWDKVE